MVGAAVVALRSTLAAAQTEATVSELLTSADLAWSARRYDDAFARYRAVLLRDSTAERAVFRMATLLAWHKELDRSASLFRRYLHLAPTDDDARVGLARTLAWQGKFDQAIAICDSVVARDPRRVDARELAAQAQAWRAAQSPSLEPIVLTTDDSDDNRATTYLLRGGLSSLWNARIVADASYRIADFGVERGTSTTLRGASTWAQGDGQWTFRAETGAARADVTDAPGSPHATRVLPLLGLRLMERPTPAFTVGGTITHAPFDETASLMLAGVATTSIGGDAAAALGSHFDLSGDGSWMRLSGGSGPNTRLSASGSLRWSATTFASLAASVRAYSYDHGAFDGYFAPKEYVLAEMSGRLHLGSEVGWELDSEVGLGNQTIALFDDSHGARFAQRATLAVGYRPVRGFEWALSGGFANVASPTTISSADYRVYTISIRGRLRL